MKRQIEAILHANTRSKAHRDHATLGVLRLINKPKTTEMIKFKLPVLDWRCNPIKDEFFMLMISDDPRQIFLYYGVTEMHGLNFDACQKRLEEGGSYIDGWCNVAPKGLNLPKFLFLNLKTMNEQPIWKTATLIMHEATHLATHYENSDMTDPEEEIISMGENNANQIMERLGFPEINFFINTKALWEKMHKFS